MQARDEGGLRRRQPAVRYISTRGGTAPASFDEILLQGPAPDGGLYLPEHWPSIPDLPAGISYHQMVAEVAAPFMEGSLLLDDLPRLAAQAYEDFGPEGPAPTRQVAGNRWILDLTLGPTLSFKDYALQLLGRLFDHLLELQGRRIMVLGATSGDTGSAAIEACRDRSAIDIVILYPLGRVSDIQRRQMTTVDSANVHAVAVEGTFDDCQDLVKAAFAEPTLRQRLALAAVNSINWARIMAQVAYYLWVGHRLGHPVDFYVPTGNFGNVLAGWAARRMGGPIKGLVVANNHNHGLTRLISQGVLSIGEVRPTLAPAMDIQIPSNLERYLFELGSRRGEWMSAMMNDYRQRGELRLEEGMHGRLGRDFHAGWLGDEGIVEVIARAHRDHGLLLDPHSALGWAMVERHAEANRPAVAVATAHPAKFPEAVIEAVGFAPQLPPRLADISERPERTTVIPARLPQLVTVLERANRHPG